ncbi:MAG: hypothetical protein O3C41_06970 [Bacteroidetes bacterium]|jgi:hypothetical protein|nr:hypothetical protein [Bacteroidota bacterium]MDA1176806.1 hypothetical protein [Bacteroidota bacterium]
MKITTYIISGIALIVLIFNATKIDFEAPLVNDSYTAVITSIAAGCAILIATLIRVVRKIDRLTKK